MHFAECVHVRLVSTYQWRTEAGCLNAGTDIPQNPTQQQQYLVPVHAQRALKISGGKFENVDFVSLKMTIGLDTKIQISAAAGRGGRRAFSRAGLFVRGMDIYITYEYLVLADILISSPTPRYSSRLRRRHY